MSEGTESGEHPTPEPDRGVSRRGLLLGAGAVAGALGAVGVGWAVETSREAGQVVEPAGPDEGTPVEAGGTHQAGVERPATPQQHCLVEVADLDITVLAVSLDVLGRHILRLTDPENSDLTLTPDGPGDLTITVGLGSSALAATLYPGLADAVTLPDFRGDASLPAERRGGGILISVNASDPLILEPVLATLTSLVAGYRPRWSDFGFRGPVDDGVSRNPLGYHDGIIGPKSDAEFDADVWIADGPLAGGTISVVRRFSLDTSAFRALPQDQRDGVIGRYQSTGAPLSGGDRDDEVDLLAKADNGDLLVPARAHARAAHPSFTGSALMLRRSYSYRTSAADHGHLFVSYQAEVETFARTQQRLDEVDDLMAFTTPTATAAFAVLPGFDERSPLGASLFR